MQPLSLDVKHLTGLSHAGAAPYSKCQLSSSQGEQRLCALDSHGSRSALQPAECSSQPALCPPALKQQRDTKKDTGSRPATSTLQQLSSNLSRACSAGQEHRIVLSNDSDTIVGRKGGSFTEHAHGSSAPAHRDVIAGKTVTVHSASPPSNVACTETGTTGLRLDLCNDASSLLVGGHAHAAQVRPPATLPQQSESASGHECGVAVQEAWVLQIQKGHAKTAKDALKSLGFLDRARKVPAAQKSDAEVALPLTSSGVAYLSTCQDRVACQQNGSSGTISASTATLMCANGHGGLSHEDPESGALPKTRTSEMPTQQGNLQVLEHFVAQGLARVQKGQAVQRRGRATPADVLLCNVLSALASKGAPALTYLYHNHPFAYCLTRLLKMFPSGSSHTSRSRLTRMLAI